MAVKIIIRRSVAKEKEKELLPLLLQLRSLATSQPGYISGETLRNLNNMEDYIVISTWKTVDDWKSWTSNSKRNEVQGKIDALLGEKTRYDAYLYG
jgi:heme-degrading monooxygenase HmoA